MSQLKKERTMNISILSRVPFSITQNILIAYLKERRFTEALTLLEASPNLATTTFPTSHQYTCLDDLLKCLCEQPDYDIEDENFMKILIFPHKESSNDLDLTNKQIRLLGLFAYLRHCQKKSSILKRISRNSQSTQVITPFTQSRR